MLIAIPTDDSSYSIPLKPNFRHKISSTFLFLKSHFFLPMEKM